MINRDWDRVELILEVADLIEERLSVRERNSFISDRHEIDLTAYRLSVIGETANKLSVELKARHPDISWADIYAMRNIIVHDYGRLDPGPLWKAATDDLPLLVAALRSEVPA